MKKITFILIIFFIFTNFAFAHGYDPNKISLKELTRQSDDILLVKVLSNKYVKLNLTTKNGENRDFELREIQLKITEVIKGNVVKEDETIKLYQSIWLSPFYPFSCNYQYKEVLFFTTKLRKISVGYYHDGFSHYSSYFNIVEDYKKDLNAININNNVRLWINKLYFLDRVTEIKFEKELVKLKLPKEKEKQIRWNIQRNSAGPQLKETILLATRLFCEKQKK